MFDTQVARVAAVTNSMEFFLKVDSHILQGMSARSSWNARHNLKLWGLYNFTCSTLKIYFDKIWKFLNHYNIVHYNFFIILVHHTFYNAVFYVLDAELFSINIIQMTK